MAGLYGFFSPHAQSAEAVHDRLAWMRSFMTLRQAHRCVEHATECGGVGITGPGLFDGTIAVHHAPSRRAFVVDGEAYHVSTPDGHACRTDAVWPAVYARWIANGAAAIGRTDGVYNAVELDPCAASGPRIAIFNDRYGSRRLYYADLPDAFVFASEVAPIVAWLGAKADVDRAFVEESVCFGSVFGNKSWIRGVSLFSPATVMTVSREGTTAVRHWRWSDVPAPGTHVTADRFERLHELWQRAVQARVDGSRVGQQLSGGLDSRLILGEAIRHRGQWMASTYGEAGSDDVRFARRCAEVAGVPWLFWPLPGTDWLERRLALSLEHDGLVDLVNAHHAGLVSTLGGLIDFEVSGYLGDVVMGGTGLDLTCETAFYDIPYWPSPVSLDASTARARVEASVAESTGAWAWMMENKRRRVTNAWPHLAVNELEVRKPFMDYALVEYCAGLPPDDRRTRRPHRELLKRFYPALARVPWQKTGVPPTAGRLARTAIKAARTGYRAAQRLAARAGLPPRPWVRNACDVNAWCAAPAIRRTLTECLTDRAALVADYFDRDAIEQTLTLAFDQQQVAIEVPMNLYRVEHMLRRLRRMRLESAR